MPGSSLTKDLRTHIKVECLIFVYVLVIVTPPLDHFTSLWYLSLKVLYFFPTTV